MTRSHKSKKKTGEKLKKVIFQIFLFFLFIVFSMTALFYLFNWEKFHIKNINIIGNENISESVINSKLEQVFSRDRIGIYPNRNILLFPKKIFLTEISSEENKIREITLSKIWPDTVNIVIRERDPEYQWCSDAGDCYFMDNEGYIFSKKYDDKVYLNFSGNENLSGELPIGSYYSNSDDFRALNNFIRISKEKFGLYFANIKNNDASSKILENVDGTKVIVNNYITDQDLYNFSRILDENDLAVRDGKFIKGVDYINMIHGNKIFYCMDFSFDNHGGSFQSECAGNFDKKEEPTDVKIEENHETI